KVEKCKLWRCLLANPQQGGYQAAKPALEMGSRPANES
ncbi:hypothetical protein L915_10133, partial [Phytophthora nicotianae]